jgi:hypothetical protein
MDMRNIKKYLILLLSVVTLVLSGCSQGNIYEHAKDYQLTDEELKLLSEEKLGVRYDKGDFDTGLDYYQYLAAEYLSRGSSTIRVYAPYIIVISVVIGIVMLLLVRKSIHLRRVAIGFFIIGIPIITYLITYGTAMLADAF